MTKSIVVPAQTGDFTQAIALTVSPTTATEDGYIKTWPVKLNDGTALDETGLSVTFDRNGDGLTTGLQTVTIITSITPNEEDTGTWAFFGNGIEVMSAEGNSQYTITSHKLSPSVLQITISQVDGNAAPFTILSDIDLDWDSAYPLAVTRQAVSNQMTISFRYAMKYTDSQGIQSIYLSQDPKFTARR